MASPSGFRKNFQTILLIWRGRKPSFDGCHHHFAIASLQGLTLSMILRNIQKVMKAYTSQQFFLSIMIEHVLWWNMFHGNTITPHYCKSSSHLWLELTLIFLMLWPCPSPKSSWASSIYHILQNSLYLLFRTQHYHINTIFILVYWEREREIRFLE